MTTASQTFSVQYRLTGYAPRSTDSTEATVLTVGGNTFKFTTMESLSGYQPYLLSVDGRDGRIDAFTRQQDVGTWEVVLLDKRTSTTNTARYVSSFLGNTAGANQLLGIKVYIEESTDNGTTWAAYATGRIIATTLPSENPGTQFSIRVRSMASELDTDVFVGQPHDSATYAVPMQIIPVGLAGAYGDFDTVDLLTGTIAASTAGTGKLINFSSSSKASVKNVLDESLRSESITFNQPALPRYSSNIRVYIDTGSATGELRLGEIETALGGVVGPIGQSFKGTAVVVDQLPVLGDAAVTSITRSSSTATVTTAAAHNRATGDIITHAGANQTGYNIAAAITVTGSTTYTYTVSGTPATPATGTIYASAYENFIPLPSNGTSVSFAVRRVGLPPDEATPLFLDDVHPVTLIQHLLSGYFGYRKIDGQVKRTFPYDSSSFTSLAADASFPLVRLRITRKWKLHEIIAAICQQTGLGYRVAGDGKVYLFDMRIPNSAPSPDTIADDDLAGDGSIEWEQSREDAISQLTVVYYDDALLPDENLPPRNVGGTIGRVALPTDSIQPIAKYVIDAESFENADIGAKPRTIDAICLRQAAGETVTSGTNGTIDREQWVLGLATNLSQSFRRPYASGPSIVKLTCRRTASVTAATVGGWVLSTVTKLVDPSSSTRGGNRLYRVLEKSYRGPTCSLVLLDAGPNSQASAPTLGALGAGTDTKHEITAAVTLNASSDPVVLHVAATDTSTGTAPAESSGAWYLVVPSNNNGPLITASGTYIISNQPSGQRIWVRARSEPAPSKDAKLPSAWTFSTGTDYQATVGLSAPSAVTNSNNSPGNTDTVTLSWTNGDANAPLEFMLEKVSGSGSTIGPFPTTPRLPAGSTSVILNDYLTANTVYTPKVRHTDAIGGYSSYGSASNLTIGAGFTGPTSSVGTIVLTEYA